MTIRVKQIIGDTVELFFNPHEVDLRVGDSLWVGEVHGQRGVIAQIIEFRTLPTPSPRQEWSYLASSHESSRETALSGQEAFQPNHEGTLIQVAIAKIRRRADPDWRQWDGWIPGPNAVATKMTDEEVLRQCVPMSGNPLKLGRTVAGEPFSIEGSTLGQVNILAHGKETRSLQLAAVMLREFVDRGAPCVVFDSTGDFSQLCRGELRLTPGEDALPAVIYLQAGQNLRLDPRQLGASSLLTLLTGFGLPRLVAMSYTSHPAHVGEPLEDLQEASQLPALASPHSLAPSHPDSTSAEREMAHAAFLSCLQAIQGTGLLASHASEATALGEAYENICHGGVLLIDISGLPNRARPGAVQACLEIIQGLGESTLQHEPRCPAVLFFEKAQLYLDGNMLGDLMGHGRLAEMTMMVLTDMVDRLDDSLLSQAENLFIFGPLSDEAMPHLSKLGLTDRESLRALVQRLQDQQGLLVGAATTQYPLIFEVDAIAAGDAIKKPRRYFRPRRLHDAPTSPSSAKHTTLPLFPEEEAVRPDASTPSPLPSAPATLPTFHSGASLAHVTAHWRLLVDRVARRRRILDTILSTARPIQLTEQTLVVGFPPQHRLQRELFDSPEYRSLLEEELTHMFGQTFGVETVLHPAAAGPQLRS